MKKLLISALATSTLLLSQSVFAGGWLEDEKLVRLCEIAKSDSKIKLITEIKKRNLRLNHVSDGLVCNGMDVVSFAKANGADKIAGLLETRQGKVDYIMLSKN
ncbi:MAG: DUF3718 domain-containing protein [Aestuariibacter sp.]